MLVHIVHGEGEVRLGNASCRLASFVAGTLRSCVDPAIAEERGIYAIDLIDAAAASSGQGAGKLLTVEALEELSAAAQRGKGAQPKPRGRRTVPLPGETVGPKDAAEERPETVAKGSRGKSPSGKSPRGRKSSTGGGGGKRPSSTGDPDASASANNNNGGGSPKTSAVITWPPAPPLHRNLSVHPSTAAVFASAGLAAETDALAETPPNSARLPHPMAVGVLEARCESLLEDRGCYVLVQALLRSEVAARGERFEGLVAETGFSRAAEGKGGKGSSSSSTQKGSKKKGGAGEADGRSNEEIVYVPLYTIPDDFVFPGRVGEAPKGKDGKKRR